MLCFRRPALVCAVLLCALSTPLPSTAQELVQTDWSGASGLSLSTDLATETGYESVTGHLTQDISGELGASAILVSYEAGAWTTILPTEGSASASAFADLSTCASSVGAFTPACDIAWHALYRDVSTGALSWVALAAGSADASCDGSLETTLAETGWTLTESVESGDASSAAGETTFAHSWTGGCSRGAILDLPTSLAETSGAIVSRQGVTSVRALLRPGDGTTRDVALAALPNDGTPGTPIDFALRGGTSGQLLSTVFNVGGRRSFGLMTWTAEIEGAQVEVYVRLGQSESNVKTRPWHGPFTSGMNLASAGIGDHVQYRVDVTLNDRRAQPSSVEPFVRITELRFGLSGICDCETPEGCFQTGGAPPATPCLICDPTTSTTQLTPAVDGMACDDGSLCTTGDVCTSGVCAGGDACDDGLVCTDDSCNESDGACTNDVTTGCAIDGACVAAMALNPADGCQVCDPTMPLAWSATPSCSGCASNDECTSAGMGVCDLSDRSCVECTEAQPGACTDAVPICDALNRTCRACGSDAECEARGGDPICSATGACVACDGHLDCEAIAPVCGDDGCRLCENGAECVARDPARPLCDITTGLCGSCDAASDCVGSPTGAVCVDTAEGRECGCVNEADCGAGLMCDTDLGVCAPLASADSDGDGVQDDKDADSDNDGIPDIVEGAGRDYSLDADEDNRPDWRDPDALGFEDANGDGTDDRTDLDGDGVPNHLDLDTDGDGIPDVLENVGRDGLDSNRDGRLDDDADVDRDGLVAAADVNDADPSVLSSALALRDTDQDATPDYRDADSDSEGENDTLEAGGTDEDGDGRLDVTRDTNRNGLADAVDPAAGGAALSLPDTDGDGVWDFQDDTNSEGVQVVGGGLCRARGSSSSPNVFLILGGLVLALVLRRRRSTR